MSDNVTPFRRPPKRPVAPQQSGGWGFKTHRGKVVLVHLLTLIGLIVAIAAVVLAYSNRGEAMPWANTHHEHALRTLVIGYAVWVVGSLLTLINGALFTIALFIQLGVLIWAAIRAGIALVLGIMRRPLWNPRGWLV